MPEISRFFGIVVAMFYNDHDPPHFHVRYGSAKARFAIDDFRLLSGSLSPRVRGFVVESATLHQDKLQRKWEAAREQRPLFPITPLE